MPERKISDEVSRSCNHVQLNTDGWCLHHVHIRKIKARKKLTHALSRWMCACVCACVWKKIKMMMKKRTGKICHIEIKFSIYGNFVFSQKNIRISNKMNKFMNLKALVRSWFYLFYLFSWLFFRFLVLFFTRFHHYYLWQEKTHSHEYEADARER